MQPLCFFHNIINWNIQYVVANEWPFLEPPKLHGPVCLSTTAHLVTLLWWLNHFSSSPGKAFDAMKSQNKQLYTLSTGYLLTEQIMNNSWRLQMSEQWWQMKPFVPVRSHVFIWDFTKKKKKKSQIYLGKFCYCLVVFYMMAKFSFLPRVFLICSLQQCVYFGNI